LKSKKFDLNIFYYNYTIMADLELMNVGLHISKKGSFLKTLQKQTNKLPVQMFSGSPKSYYRKMMDIAECSQLKQYLKNNNLNVYIHSIYLINLCRPRDDNKRAMNCLEMELMNSNKCGFSGVIVHCGKSVKIPIHKAIISMYTNIKSVLKYATPECPLLLETPAGQGTEVCVDIDVLKRFYSNFNEKERSVLKICIDTCHVFSAGYDPLEYLISWNETYPNSIYLVHFNDSKEICGCKKDRHAYPGLGCIGLDKMIKVAHWCNIHNIPMVYE
tara:strand:+ start:364 stop:1182 length:819 start_codon:yes stop_codon:yes gene_type:complete